MYFEQATWIALILGAIMLIVSPFVFQFAKNVKPKKFNEGYHPLEHAYLTLLVFGTILFVGGGVIMVPSVIAKAVL